MHIPMGPCRMYGGIHGFRTDTVPAAWQVRAEHYAMTVEFDHVCSFEPAMTHCWQLEEASQRQGT